MNNMTEEELMGHDFITNINYPRYSEVMNILADDVECKYVYNGHSHELICNVWYNIWNDNAVTNIGLTIQNRGGNTALRICFIL